MIKRRKREEEKMTQERTMFSWEKKNFAVLLREEQERIQQLLMQQVQTTRDFIEKEEEKFVFHELPELIDGKTVGSLDGGMAPIDLSSTFISLTRASGNTWPGSNDWIENLNLDFYSSPQNLDNFIYLNMALQENMVALRLIEERKPDVLILDGSIESLFTVGLPRTLIYELEREKQRELDLNDPISRHLELFRLFVLSVGKLIKGATKNDTLLLGVSKDSRARILLPDELKKNTSITDVGYVSIHAFNQTGFTEGKKHPVRMNPVTRKFMKESIPVTDEFDYGKPEIVTFYVKLASRSLPFRLDMIPYQAHRVQDALGILQRVQDGEGYPIPPQLAHERAHITPDLVQLVESFCIEKIKEIDYNYYISLFSPSRRSLIQ